LERRIGPRDFNSGGPPLDADGLPCWDGKPGLSVDSYARLLDQAIPDEDLSGEELATRERLSPYSEVFARLEETEKARGEDVT
jgi:hypothetical protein